MSWDTGDDADHLDPELLRLFAAESPSEGAPTGVFVERALREIQRARRAPRDAPAGLTGQEFRRVRRR